MVTIITPKYYLWYAPWQFPNWNVIWLGWTKFAILPVSYQARTRIVWRNHGYCNYMSINTRECWIPLFSDVLDGLLVHDVIILALLWRNIMFNAKTMHSCPQNTGKFAQITLEYVLWSTSQTTSRCCWNILQIILNQSPRDVQNQVYYVLRTIVRNEPIIHIVCHCCNVWHLFWMYCSNTHVVMCLSDISYFYVYTFVPRV
jgi:hypothetical protein